jgi:hypothetical protein
MQLDQLILFNQEGESRRIDFRAGRLNIITGDSRTGKSCLIGIIRFLLGSASPNVPFGTIQQSVAWYGLHAHVGETRFFIARAAPPPGHDSNDAMLVIDPAGTPAFDKLVHNNSRAGLRDYLGGLLGVEDNRNEPTVGQTRHPLSASFKHSLFYCFQGQGEIANPEILFHRQNREWRAQAIRDTLPYFLGAQGPDDLRRREELTERRRQLRRLQQRVRAAEAERSAGLDRAGALLTESVDVGLLETRTGIDSLADAQRKLRDSLDNPVGVSQSQAGNDEFGRLGDQRRALIERVRDLGEQIRALEQFAAADENQSTELTEQHARLASIGIIPSDGADATCALCGQGLPHDGEARGTIESALGRAERRLELARRDTPRIDAARRALLEQRRATRDEIRDIDQALSALATRDELVLRTRDAINVQSYVRGRIAQYLETIEDTDDSQLEQLRKQVEQAEQDVVGLAATFDAGAIRSRTDSLLRTVSHQMTAWARELKLEHADGGALIDLDRLTIVADTPSGPAYMDAGGIGSGMNWVGYHLTAYLALQQFFIEHARPVPSFIVLDQPSQAFFPRDRERGGDLDELTDTDRENTRKLYELTHQIVDQLGGALQVVALDHADFGDTWFDESVIERWRDGDALIPPKWRNQDEADTTAPDTRPSDPR